MAVAHAFQCGLVWPRSQLRLCGVQRSTNNTSPGINRKNQIANLYKPISP